MAQPKANAPGLSQDQIGAHFTRVAESYEEGGGNTTKAVSRDLISLCSPTNPISSKSVIHDNGCGPGITTGEIIALKGSQWAAGKDSVPKIHATDFSPGMIKVLNAKGWREKYGVESAVMDGQDLKFPSDTFTHSFTNFVIFALRDAMKGTSEIHRTLKPGGVALVTTWASVGWLGPFQRAQRAIKPDEPLFQGPLPVEWSTAEKLRDVLVSGGFEEMNVKVSQTSVGFQFQDWNQGFKPMEDLAIGMITKGWTAGEKADFEDTLHKELDIERERNEVLYSDVWCGVARK